MINYTKTAIIGAAMMAVAIATWGLFVGGKNMARAGGGSQDTPSSEAGRVAENAWDQTNLHGASPIVLTNDADLQLLGSLAANFPGETRPLFKQMARLAGCIEIEKRKFNATTSHGRTLLEGLRRKLLVDDFEYAALLTGKIDKSEAKPFYNLLASRLDKMSDEELGQRGYGGITNGLESPSANSGKARGGEGNRPPEKVAERFRQHYALFITGSAIGYSEILKTLRQYTDRDVLASDLFKDVGIYVGEQTQIKDWMEQEKRQSRAMDRQTLSQVKNPGERTNIAHRSKLLEDSVNASYAGLPEALRRVFEYRLRERYQLDPGLFAQLDALTLRNAGSELRIPAE